MHIDLCLKGWK